MTAHPGQRTTTGPATRPPATDRPRPRRVALVAALAAAVLVAAATGAPWTWDPPAWLGPLADPAVDAPEPLPAPTPAPTEPPRPVPESGSDLLTWLLALAGLVVFVLALLALRAALGRVRRHRDPRPPDTATPGDALVTTDDDVLPHLRHAVRHAEDRLAPTVPPRDAVVAAWVALEDAAALAGTRRDPAQTPTEFTVAVLESTPADRGAVATLRDLYHRARFRGVDVDAHDVETARRALRRLAADLAVDAARPAPPHDTPGTTP